MLDQLFDTKEGKTKRLSNGCTLPPRSLLDGAFSRAHGDGLNQTNSNNDGSPAIPLRQKWNIQLKIINSFIWVTYDNNTLVAWNAFPNHPKSGFCPIMESNVVFTHQGAVKGRGGFHWQAWVWILLCWRVGRWFNEKTQIRFRFLTYFRMFCWPGYGEAVARPCIMDDGTWRRAW